MTIPARLTQGILKLIGKLPLKAHYANSRFTAWLVGDVFRYRRDVVSSNLARCFPEKTAGELNTIRREFYRHFADIVAEAIWFGACNNPERLRQAHIVEIKNPAIVNKLYDSAPSIVVLLSHFGNWELLGGILNYNYTGEPICFSEQNFCVVHKEMSSRTWDEVMRCNRLAPLTDRESFKGYLETKDFIRYAYRHMDEKKVYNVITDQRPYASSKGNVPVTFMGIPTRSMTGAAAVACKFGMAVCYARMRQESRGHYAMEYIPICADAAATDPESIMERYYEFLEEDIREQPSAYLWTHKRFK